MKTLMYSLAIGLGILMTTTSKAQVSFGISIGRPAPIIVAPAPMPPAGPVWMNGPSMASYYYFPDINCYYDAGINQYIYFQNNRWLYSRGIPPMYSGYNFNRGRRMPLNVNQFRGRGIPMYSNRGGGPIGRGPQGGGYGNHGGNQFRGNGGGYERHDNGHHNGWRR